MEIHIDRLGEKMGPYSIEEASELLRDQTLHETDLAWHEGMGKWELLPSVLASIHPTLTADQAALPKVETSGDLSKPIIYPPDKRHEVNNQTIWNLGLTINVWGIVFLLLFFEAHRPVIDVVRSRLAGNVIGHWQAKSETTSAEGKEFFTTRNYSFHSRTNFSRTFSIIYTGFPEYSGGKESFIYTIRGNKIIYKIKRGKKERLETKNSEEMEKIWYYKVSSDGKQLLLSTSPDFLDPLILEKSGNINPFKPPSD